MITIKSADVKLLAKLALQGPLRRARLQRKFEKQGADIVDKMKAVVPVDKGSLRASIRMIPAQKKPGVVIIAGGTAATARGRNLDEALLTEYGTRKERAEPFFWPTINQATSVISRALADNSDDGQGDGDA